jgi:hypothetical protein
LGVVATYLAEESLARAVAVLGDARRDHDEREDAACILQLVIRRMHPSEAALVDVFHALSRSLDVYLAPRWILGAISSLRPPVVEKLAGGVERLLQREYLAGRFDILADVLLVVLDEPIWAARLREEWMRAAIAAALERLPESKTTIALLIGGWVLARGEALEWIADLVEERPELVTTGMLPVATRWVLFRIRPHVAGWKSLAVARGPCPALDAAYFNHQASVAVDTLEAAIGQTPDDARRLTLARWLVAVRGSMP